MGLKTFTARLVVLQGKKSVSGKVVKVFFFPYLKIHSRKLRWIENRAQKSTGEQLSISWSTHSIIRDLVNVKKSTLYNGKEKRDIDMCRNVIKLRFLLSHSLSST